MHSLGEYMPWKVIKTLHRLLSIVERKPTKFEDKLALFRMLANKQNPDRSKAGSPATEGLFRKKKEEPESKMSDFSSGPRGPGRGK